VAGEIFTVPIGIKMAAVFPCHRFLLSLRKKRARGRAFLL
jgi:hypothetical protein